METAGVFDTALRLAGNKAQQSALLAQIAAGKLVVAFAHGERQARYDLSDVLTRKDLGLRFRLSPEFRL